MKKSFKKIFASFLAISTLAVGMTGLNASANADKQSWEVRYSPGAPGNVTSKNVTLWAYGNGYINYTSDISGSNDRSLTIQQGGQIRAKVTTTGYSSKISISSSSNIITFSVNGHGSSYYGKGILGHYGKV